MSAKKLAQLKGKKAKNATAKKVGQYQMQVLDINANLKTVRKSFGGCIKVLLTNSKEIGLTATQVKILRLTQKDIAKFKAFKATVRTSHYKGQDLGTYSPFYVLQALYKEIKNA